MKEPEIINSISKKGWFILMSGGGVNKYLWPDGTWHLSGEIPSSDPRFDKLYYHPTYEAALEAVKLWQRTTP